MASSGTIGSGRRGRGPKKIAARMGAAQPSKLQAVESDPLGPLGTPPVAAEPQQEENIAPAPTRRAGANQQASLPDLMGSTSLGDDEGFTGDGSIRSRGPPPVQPPTGEVQGQRQAPPSQNIVEAAKPTYNITVGDPHKVGDLTTSHTEYQVYTKVCLFLNATRPLKLTRMYEDHFESLPQPRIRRLPPLSRFPLALQSTPPK